MKINRIYLIFSRLFDKLYLIDFFSHYRVYLII